VPEGAFGDWARVSIGTKEEMDLFFGEMAKILGKT
jgi:histidinol-phosphate/aromatic aminotransferase/cobyric acid decarboxylase-like protein